MPGVVGAAVVEVVVHTWVVALVSTVVCAVLLAVWLPLWLICWLFALTLGELLSFAGGVGFPFLMFFGARQIVYWKSSISNLMGTVRRLVEHVASKERVHAEQMGELKQAARSETQRLQRQLSEAAAERESLFRRYDALGERASRWIAGLKAQVTEQAGQMSAMKVQWDGAAARIHTLSSENRRLREHLTDLTLELRATKEIAVRQSATVSRQGGELGRAAARCAALEQQLAECQRALSLSELKREARAGEAEQETRGEENDPLEIPDPGAVASDDIVLKDSFFARITGAPAGGVRPAGIQFSGGFILAPGTAEVFSEQLSVSCAIVPYAAAADQVNGSLFQAECPCEGCAAHHPETHYGLLGVPRTASTKEVTAAYLRLAATVHPDKPGGSAQAMQQLVEAAEVLRDPRRRQRYDSGLRYWCNEQSKDLMKSLKFVAVTVPSGGRIGLAFTKQGEFPSVRAVQAGSPADEAGLGRYIGKPIAFICMQKVVGWTGQQIHQKFAGRRIFVVHFWG